MAPLVHTLSRALASLLLFLFLAPDLAAAEPPSVKIGNRKIRSPAPQGFVRIDGLSAKVDDLFKTMAPLGVRVVAWFGTEAALESVRAGNFPSAERFCALLTLPEIEEENVELADFPDLKKEVRESLVEDARDGMDEETRRELDKIVQDLNAKQKAEISIKPGTSFLLGTFGETARSLCFTQLMRMQVTAGPGKRVQEPAQVSSCGVLLVRKRVLMLACYARYRQQEDASWTREALLAWRDAITAANRK